MVSAIERGDRAYLEGLGLTSKQIDPLLNKTPQFEMTFGTAAELAVEQAVRADPFLSQYVKRGPQGRVPRGVGKPDWIIETPSSRIPVDLMTPEQVTKKLEMWRRQSFEGKPKWYVEKGLNITYDTPSTRPAEVPPAAPPEIAQVARTSGFRTAGRFLAEEVPGLALQLALMVLFAPGVNFHNDKLDELNRTKLDPAINDALVKRASMIDKLLHDKKESQSVFANVTAILDYDIAYTKLGDAELTLKDATFLDMKITNEFVQAEVYLLQDTRHWSKRITYSFPFNKDVDASTFKSFRDLASTLKDPNDKVRFSSVLGIYKLVKDNGSLRGAAIQLLMPTLLDETENVRAAAAVVLQSLGATEAIPLIVIALAQTNNQVYKSTIQKSLDRLDRLQKSAK